MQNSNFPKSTKYSAGGLSINNKGAIAESEDMKEFELADLLKVGVVNPIAS